MSALVPPSKRALEEAEQLAEEILRNIELSELPLATICLKASRLARLLNDFEHQKIFEYEVSGYPSTPTGVPVEVWALAKKAGRVFEVKDGEKVVEKSFIGSISSLEETISTNKIALEASKDPNVSVHSANPNQFLGLPLGNKIERSNLSSTISTTVTRLAARTGYLHSYVSGRYYELRFSGVTGDIFSRLRERVDSVISSVVPDSVQKITAIYDNLRSNNPEDWSNAVHGCRRLLQDLADAVFPSREDRVVATTSGKTRTVKLGPDNYINRLICYIEDNSGSKRFEAIVGSHLNFMGERLDAVFQAAQKGSHAVIADRQEADRYVIYTYMIVADILTLAESPAEQEIIVGQPTEADGQVEAISQDDQLIDMKLGTKKIH